MFMLLPLLLSKGIKGLHMECPFEVSLHIYLANQMLLRKNVFFI